MRTEDPSDYDEQYFRFLRCFVKSFPLLHTSEALPPCSSTAYSNMSVLCSVISRSQITLGTMLMGDWAWMRLFTPPLFSSVLTCMPTLWLPVKQWHPWSGFWAYQGRDAFERTDVSGLNLPSTQTATLLPLYICSGTINNCPLTHRNMAPMWSWPLGITSLGVNATLK